MWKRKTPLYQEMIPLSLALCRGAPPVASSLQTNLQTGLPGNRQQATSLFTNRIPTADLHKFSLPDWMIFRSESFLLPRKNRYMKRQLKTNTNGSENNNKMAKTLVSQIQRIGFWDMHSTVKLRRESNRVDKSARHPYSISRSLQKYSSAAEAESVNSPHPRRG